MKKNKILYFLFSLFTVIFIIASVVCFVLYKKDTATVNAEYLIGSVGLLAACAILCGFISQYQKSKAKPLQKNTSNTTNYIPIEKTVDENQLAWERELTIHYAKYAAYGKHVCGLYAKRSTNVSVYWCKNNNILFEFLGKKFTIYFTQLINVSANNNYLNFYYSYYSKETGKSERSYISIEAPYRESIDWFVNEYKTTKPLEKPVDEKQTPYKKEQPIHNIASLAGLNGKNNYGLEYLYDWYKKTGKDKEKLKEELKDISVDIYWCDDEQKIYFVFKDIDVYIKFDELIDINKTPTKNCLNILYRKNYDDYYVKISIKELDSDIINQFVEKFQQIESDIYSYQKYSKYKSNSILTDYEEYFYRNELKPVCDKYGFHILSKIRLGDLVESSEDWDKKKKIRNGKVRSKHIDFALAKSDNLTILALIELDDEFHDKLYNEIKDKFINNVCKKAGYKIIRKRYNDYTNIEDKLIQEKIIDVNMQAEHSRTNG